MNKPVKISAVIITYNEERNIGSCLDSVKAVADEIVVVDSYSTDKTQEICSRMNVKFLQHHFEGHIEQKNYAVSCVQYGHVLSLDADEILSEKLKQSIIAAKQNWRFDGYSFNRSTNYCGNWIRHSGWYPDTKLRLWNRTKGAGAESIPTIGLSWMSKAGSVILPVMCITIPTAPSKIISTR